MPNSNVIILFEIEEDYDDIEVDEWDPTDVCFCSCDVHGSNPLTCCCQGCED